MVCFGGKERKGLVCNTKRKYVINGVVMAADIWRDSIHKA